MWRSVGRYEIHAQSVRRPISRVRCIWVDICNDIFSTRTSESFNINELSLTERQRNDQVHTNTHGPLEIITPSITNQIIHHEHRNKENHNLKRLKPQCHRPLNRPTQAHQERRHEQRDLQRTPHRDAKGKVHLVLVADYHGGHVLCRIADNR